MKKHLSTILLLGVMAVGLTLLLYPSVSDYWNSFHQSRAIASYSESVAMMTQADYDRMWSEAEAFNLGAARRNSINLPEEERAVYESLLNVSETGIMGYIEIPLINVALPIYHGTSESVLQVAIGHLDWTSLPVGGESSHAVISGHRGLPSAKLFTDLDQMVPGDIFMIQTLNDTLTYEVDQIRIVEPQEVNDLTIIPGGDYFTLVTCTPYGINSHRLLVRGIRTENLPEASSVRVTSEAMQIEPMLVAPIAAAPMLIVLMVLFLTGGKRKR